MTQAVDLIKKNVKITGVHLALKVCIDKKFSCQISGSVKDRDEHWLLGVKLPEKGNTEVCFGN